MASSGSVPQVSMAFLGDIMVARNVEHHFLQSPQDFEMLDIREFLSGCDYIHGNLETPISDVGSPHYNQDPNVCFCAAPETVKILETIGVDSVSLANNHVLDYGEQALRRTMSLLAGRQIDSVGAGENYRQANAPLFASVGPYRVALIASNFINSASTRRATGRSPGAADSRLKNLVSTVRAARKKADIVTLTIHWGLEYSFYPLPYIQRAARALVDAGAALVVGHGPHYVQPIEKYKNGTIAYSLGNFVFDEPFMFANISYILKVRLCRSGVEQVEVCPVVIRDHVPHISSGWRANRTRRFVEDCGSNFSSKRKRFWQDLSNTYFRDMLGRTFKTRSLKYLSINPIGFYLDVGLANYLQKLGLSKN